MKQCLPRLHGGKQMPDKHPEPEFLLDSESCEFAKKSRSQNDKNKQVAKPEDLRKVLDIEKLDI